MATEALNEYLQLSDAYTQVRLIEAIRDVPAQWTKLLPLLNKSMEETQSIQELLPHLEEKPKSQRVSFAYTDRSNT